MIRKLYSIVSILFFINEVLSVPPEACFANFNWDDCGRPPVPVMYYWKPGSRCEVGLWRGCLPNINMFQDEYECVSTCIFTIRAMPDDYHNILNVPEDQELITSEPLETTTYAATEEGTTAGDAVDTTSGGAGGNETSGNSTEGTTAAAAAPASK